MNDQGLQDAYDKVQVSLYQLLEYKSELEAWINAILSKNDQKSVKSELVKTIDRIDKLKITLNNFEKDRPDIVALSKKKR